MIEMGDEIPPNLITLSEYFRSEYLIPISEYHWESATLSEMEFAAAAWICHQPLLQILLGKPY